MGLIQRSTIGRGFQFRELQSKLVFSKRTRALILRSDDGIGSGKKIKDRKRPSLYLYPKALLQAVFCAADVEGVDGSIFLMRILFNLYPFLLSYTQIAVIRAQSSKMDRRRVHEIIKCSIAASIATRLNRCRLLIKNPK